MYSQASRMPTLEAALAAHIHLVAVIVEACFADEREPLGRQLVAAIAARPDRAYWDSWTVALEQLLLAAD